MDGPRDYHNKWRTSEKERQCHGHHLHVNSKIRQKWTYLWDRNRLTDTDSQAQTHRHTLTGTDSQTQTHRHRLTDRLTDTESRLVAAKWSKEGWVGSSGFANYCGSAGKESACDAGDLGLIPGLGGSPGEGKGCPLQYSGLENSTDCIVHGVAKSWTRLSDVHCSLITDHWYRQWIKKKILPYNTRNYIQYPMINHTGK